MKVGKAHAVRHIRSGRYLAPHRSYSGDHNRDLAELPRLWFKPGYARQAIAYYTRIYGSLRANTATAEDFEVVDIYLSTERPRVRVQTEKAHA